ncbi:hypothetical protein PIB30_079260 [Stylosanthes scabra]|uniref:Zinc finger GRF-type domain-containing protein n=1 Tax=Stylosanthes scabra TaxID=79078 RepID=A0ABU6YQ64_9FABA|nr:hypothetical protein [Stylosanthes scabra]
MESEGVSLGSKRSVGSGKSERSSSTRGVFAAKVREGRYGAAPTCHFGVYVILYLSKTANNRNRLFFGFPFFKDRLPHCKFFLWHDRHTEKLGKIEAGKCSGKRKMSISTSQGLEWRIRSLN